MQLVAQTMTTGLLLGSLYAIVAVGLTIIFGLGRVINFAHGEFTMVAGYGVAFVTGTAFGYLGGLVLGMVVAVALGLLVEKFIIARGLYDAPEHVTVIVTFALAVGLANLALLLAGSTPIAVRSPFDGLDLQLAGVSLSGQRTFAAATGVVCVSLLTLWLRRSSMGLQVRAVAQNPAGALYSGINIRRVRQVGFGLGAGFAGLAGALTAPILTVYPTMGSSAVVIAFTVVVLGGLGSIGGAVLGGVIYGVMYSFVSTYVSVEWTTAVGWATVIVMLLVRPRGLMGSEPTRV